jgi:hypothetical protein
MNNRFIFLEETELAPLIHKALLDYGVPRQSTISTKLYSVNGIAKLTGKSHRTIKKLVGQGVIKSTKNGLITEDAINDYLLNK